MKADNENVTASMLAWLLRPVARFCIRRSVKLQMFLEVAKQVLLEVARDEMKLKQKEATISRLSVMTGIHRRDITRLLSGDSPKSFAGDVLSRVVGQWQSDSRFSKRGASLPLVLGGGSGSFALLVRSVSKELNPYTVLFELERLGLVTRVDDAVLLTRQEYTPKRDAKEAFRLVSADIEDIICAAESNTFDSSPIPHLHLTTRFDNLTVESLPVVRKWLMEEGARIHRRARAFLGKYDKDVNPRLKDRVGGGRVSIGTFSVTSDNMKSEQERK